jgi:hypothetical protein
MEYQLELFQVSLALDKLVLMCLKPSVVNDANCWKTSDGQLETTYPTWKYYQVHFLKNTLSIKSNTMIEFA